MNWSGVVFGVSLALVLVAGAGAAFAPRLRAAVFCLSAAMFGVAGVCSVLGHGVLAILVALVLGLAVPATLLLALRIAPAAEPDLRTGGRVSVVALATLAACGGLAWVVARAPWAPAGGSRQDGVEWLGSRLLTDHLLLVDLIAALLAAAACGAVALLRGRAARR